MHMVTRYWSTCYHVHELFAISFSSLQAPDSNIVWVSDTLRLHALHKNLERALPCLTPV